MFLNTNIVLERDPINGQPMVDPMGQGGSFPLDVARIIFKNLKSDLPSVACVCRKSKKRE